jgi:hypothetical protein
MDRFGLLVAKTQLRSRHPSASQSRSMDDGSCHGLAVSRHTTVLYYKMVRS